MAFSSNETFNVVWPDEVDCSSPELRFQSIASLLEKGYSVSRKTGLPEGNGLTESQNTIFLTEKSANELPSIRGAYVSTRGKNSVALVDAIEGAKSSLGLIKREWKPWFPVIDYDRCTNCMQCLSFCLFGVYGVDDGRRIQVQNNDNCKTNCPACSRVCPEAAIMFPKYKAGPINGDNVSDEDMRREKMKVDISSLLGGDIYQMLRVRSERAKSRFSKERDSEKALNERQKCLIKLAESGDIPAEVLMSLPSPEEIKRRAEEAAVKAAAARGN
ncbi:MAG: ferredoxin family protein [Verrucomicrobiales bacterium]|nr:ferredoxin family protein [Verrucomicrobiales bacterium]MDB6130668.1 ferredoxin family protein [Verrucomicrobiales bacterium]